MKFERVKYYFEAGHWSALMVKNAVKKGWITKDQYTEITNEEYTID